MNEKHNVLMITLDSCRYDTAKVARTPNLDKISKLHLAETPGSYTYPAHNSFFIGILPRPLDNGGKYFMEYEQVWRPTSARDTTRLVFEGFNESNVIDHYTSQQYKVFGYGGVSFFDANNDRNSLPNLFPNFVYYGNGMDSDGNKFPRSVASFPLGHVEEIGDRVNSDKPFFLFINESCTHIPYDFPSANITAGHKRAIEKLYAEHYSIHNKFYKKEELPLSDYEIHLLKNLQIESLEWADGQIGKLLSYLNSALPTLVIVMADHGDEFGEHGRFGHAHNSPEVLTVPLWVGIMR